LADQLRAVIQPNTLQLTIGDAIELTGASRNTLKWHFRALIEHGQHNQHGSGRGVWYELR